MTGSKTAAPKRQQKRRGKPLFESSEWTFETMQRTYDAIQEVALEDLGLDIYPNQVEVISAEQMLDAYASHGLPLMYGHWSFGKRFVREEVMYRKGYAGLAYEIVINSNPCISYNMEGNTMALQALVMAHAAFGHNHFFKNNYLFRQWTDAEGILEYLEFAKSYIAGAEERHGHQEVEALLDAAHAVMDHGVFRYRRPPKLLAKARADRERERQEYEARTFRDIWRTVPRPPDKTALQADEREAAKRKDLLKLPEENLLYFIEKNSPVLEEWQREILRIVRNIAQYFYPQKQTKVMNEGCATFVHHYIVNALYDKGLLTEGAMLEILHNHSNVVFQPGFDDPRYNGINPYALGFDMMQDIRRIATEPTEEDREWHPEFAGSGDWRSALREAWANYRDESFILQYLSPHLIRKWRFFVLEDRDSEPHYEVSDIHDEAGYRRVRQALARSYDLSAIEPDIQIVDVELLSDRELKLHHYMRDRVPLIGSERDRVLHYLRQLWGYDVSLEGIDSATGKSVYKAGTSSD
ncbi:SpoVR family protein [Pelagibius marinus]|uniref:SpoVR family protein n=1 Tax=Pelagibius marinus TaxID=2762760 RepID=UPI0018727154|nr:SpoVR family protein [Pelagibius marinus]